MISWDKCGENYNNLKDLSDRLYVPNEREDVNLKVIKMMVGINTSKLLVKHFQVFVDVD